MKQLDEQALHIWNQHMFLSNIVKELFLLQVVPGQTVSFLDYMTIYFMQSFWQKKHKTEQINTPP